MKKLVMSMFVVFFFLTVFVNGAFAITYSTSAPITATGQFFQFQETNVADSIGTGLFTIRARGDYDYVSEYLHFNLDGHFFGTAGPGSSGGFDSLYVYGGNDYYWTRSFTISSIFLDAITADSIINLTLQNTPEVNNFFSYDYVSYSLQYDEFIADAPVPEPSTWLLLGTGLAGLAYYRKKKS